jgi:hypothetical protein
VIEDLGKSSVEPVSPILEGLEAIFDRDDF